MPLSSLTERFRALFTGSAGAKDEGNRLGTHVNPNSLEASLRAGAERAKEASSSSSSRRRRPRLSLGRRFFFGPRRAKEQPDLDDDEDTSPLPTYPEAYELQEVVGKGMTAVVYAARVVVRESENDSDKTPKKKSPKRVAVKIVDLDALSDSAMDAVLRETRLLGKLRHRGLMPPRASFISGPSLWMVLPLAAASARDVLDAVYPGRGLPERSAAAIVATVAEVLAYAHAQGVVHRDVKAQNVLLSLENGGDGDDGGDADDDNEGEAEENGDGGGGGEGTKATKPALSPPPPPPPLGRARLSDLGSGNASDALLSMRGGSFKRNASCGFSPPGSASASLTGGGGSTSGLVGGSGSTGGTGRVPSFARTSLTPLPEEVGGGRGAPAPPPKKQAPPPPSAAASDAAPRAAGGAARAARAAAARRLSTYRTFAGSPAWMAPEVVEQGPSGYYGPACDVFSLGALLVELATGQPPGSSLPYETLMMERLHGEEPLSLDLKRTAGYSAAAAELAEACMRRDPKERPSAREVLSSSWLAQTLNLSPGGGGGGGGEGAGAGGGGGGTGVFPLSSSAAAALASAEEIGALIEQYREAKEGAGEKASAASAASSASLPRPSPPPPPPPPQQQHRQLAAAPEALLCSKSAAEALRQRRRLGDSSAASSSSAAALNGKGSNSNKSCSSSSRHGGFVAAALRKFGSGGSSGSGGGGGAAVHADAAAATAATAESEGESESSDEDGSSPSSPPWDTSCDPRDVFGPEWARGVLRLQLFPSAVKARLSEAAAAATAKGFSRKSSRSTSGGGGNSGGLRRQARAAVLEPPISSFSFLGDEQGTVTEDENDRLRCFRDGRAVLVMCREVRAPKKGAAAAAAATASSSSSGVEALYSRALAAAFFRVPTVPQPLTLAEKGLTSLTGAGGGSDNAKAATDDDDAAATLAAAIELAREGGHGSVPAGSSAWAGPIYFFVTQRAESSLATGEALMEQLRRERELWEAGGSGCGGGRRAAAALSSRSSSEASGRGNDAGCGSSSLGRAPSSLGRASSSALPPIPDAGEEEEEDPEEQREATEEEGTADEGVSRALRIRRLTSTKSESSSSSYFLEPTSRGGNLSGAPSLNAPPRAAGCTGEGGIVFPEPLSPLLPVSASPAVPQAETALAAAAGQDQPQQLPASSSSSSPSQRQKIIGKLFLLRLRRSSSSSRAGGGGRERDGAELGEGSAASRSGGGGGRRGVRGSTPTPKPEPAPLLEAPPPRRALRACDASVVLAQMLLPASDETQSRKDARKKREENERDLPPSSSSSSSRNPDFDSRGCHCLPLLPAPLLGATLHVLRTPHSAGRLAYLLIKASEVAAAAEARAEAEEEERQLNSNTKRKNASGRRSSSTLSSLPAFRLAPDPMTRIPGDDLPPAVTLAAGAVGPLYTATTPATTATAQDEEGRKKAKKKRKKKKKIFERWLVPAGELTAAAHGKERCCVGSACGGDLGRQGSAGSSGSGNRRVVAGGISNRRASELDISALLAGKVPPPPSWSRFIEDLQVAQDLATMQERRGGGGGEEKEEAAAPEEQPEAAQTQEPPLSLETARSILSSGSIPVSPFSAATSLPSSLPSRENSSGGGS